MLTTLAGIFVTIIHFNWQLTPSRMKIHYPHCLCEERSDEVIVHAPTAHHIQAGTPVPLVKVLALFY
jgi:hypothetical protein